jgi:CBS domain-containing protein
MVVMLCQQEAEAMNERRIYEIMVALEEYPCISEEDTLRQAIHQMTRVQILRGHQATLARVALVFDQSRRELLGVLRRRDIMRGLEPRFLLSGSLDYDRRLFDVEVDPNLAELSYEKITARMRQQADRPVHDFMVPIAATIDYEDHIMKAIYEMVDRNTSLLPVLREGEIVGVVRSVDVLNEIASIIGS